MTIPADLKYTKEHEWLRVERDVATIGISDYAQDALGDIVFVELPEIGRAVDAGEAYAVVESVKAVSDVYAPATGEVIAINKTLETAPELINTDPCGKGWIARIRLTDADLSHLMDAETYAAYLEE